MRSILKKRVPVTPDTNLGPPPQARWRNSLAQWAMGGLFAVFSLGNVLPATAQDVTESAQDLTIGISATHNFGEVIVGSSATYQFTLVQSNDVQEQIGTVESVEAITTDASGNETKILSQDFILTQDSCSGITFSITVQCQFTVEFKPLSGGEKSATVFVPRVNASGNQIQPVTVLFNGTGIAAIEATPTSHDFGDIEVGSSSRAQTIRVSVGNSGLPIGQVSLSGDADFVVSHDRCSNKTVRRKCAVKVQFNPQSVGAKTATLSIPYGAPDTQTLEVPLSGNGIEPPMPNIEVEPMVETFDDTQVGSASTYKEITISNTGDAPLALGQLNLSGDKDDFKYLADSCSNKKVRISGRCIMHIRFKPQSVGAKTATLEIPSNDPDTPTVNVSLNGTGVGWCQGNYQHYFRAWPTTPDFGTELVDSSTSQYQSVYSWARGCDALKMDTITVTGDNADEFSIKNKRCYHGQWRDRSYSSCRFTMVFSPTEVGTKTAELTVTFNDTTVKTIPLQAVGIDPPGQPNITVSPSAHDFGTVIVGRGASSPRFTVTNTGNVNLKLGKIAITGANASEFKANLWNCAYKKFLRPSEQCYIYRVQLTPTSAGNKQANLTIASNATTVEVPLTGTAQEPEDCSDASITIETRESGNWAQLVYVSGQWVWEGSTNAWQRLANLQPGEFAIPNKPREDDVVRINAGHEIIGIPFAKVKTLCIENGGKLTSLKGDNIQPGSPLEIQATDYIENSGQIWGMGSYHEASGISCSQAQIGTNNCAYPGASILLKAGTNIRQYGKAGDWWWYSPSSGGPILNKGEIIAGNGGNGSQYGAPGGNAIILGRNTTNKTAIKAGHGGDILGTGTGEGGRGGLTQIWGKLGGAGHLSNTNGAKAFAGDGGDCNPSATASQTGGRGGNLWLVSLPNVHLSGGHHRAGEGGTQCTVNGQDGWVRIEPNVIDLSGADTRIEGGDVTIFGGKDWTLDLSGISGTVITATGDITLSVGEGGAIDMRGSTGKLFKSEAGQVNVFADEIVADEGAALSDIIEATNIVVGPSKILREVSLVSPSASMGEPDDVLPISITLTNTGAETDTYTITATDTAGWPLSQLPPSLDVEALQSVDLVLNVTLPSTPGAQDVVTVMAVSQNDPEANAIRKVQVSATNKPSGQVSIDPSLVNLPRVKTAVDNKANVTLHATSEDGTLDLSHFEGSKAIAITNKVTLAVGKSGVIDLRGNKSTILKAGEVVIFADNSQILLDPGVKLSDVITTGKMVRKPTKPPRSVALTGPSSLSEQAGTIAPVKFTLANAGLQADTYTLSATDSAGWTMTRLPTAKHINGLERFDLWMNVTLPSTVGETDVITVTATSQTDPTVTATAEVTLISGTNIDTLAICPGTGTFNVVCSCRGNVLKNVTLGPEANVSDCIFDGTNQNQGIVSQATIEAGAVLKGGKLTGAIINKGTLVNIEFVGSSLKGGILSGDIYNNSQVGGVFVDVHLAANTRITGGAVQGDISGEPNAQALLTNVTVKPGSRLSHVIIGENVQLPEDVVFGEGLRFTRHADLPTGVELIGLLPDLFADGIEGANYPKRADFSADVLEPSDGLLSAINALPELKDNAWALNQDAELSYLGLNVENLRFAVLPVSIKKAAASAGLKVQCAQRVLFTTDTGLEVSTQPALQAPSALLSALTALGLSEFTVQTNGNLQIPASEDVWFSARPDWLSTEVGPDMEMGFKAGKSSYGKEFISVSLVFTDSEGKTREQFIRPAIAQPKTLHSSAKEVSLEGGGLLSFKLGSETYRGVMDYQVTQGPEAMTDTLQVESIPDANGDGIGDVVLIYPNGERQNLFVVVE